MNATLKTALLSVIGMWIILVGQAACQDGASPGTGGKPDQTTDAQTNA